jgi:large subunit ribosomal protein L19
MNQKLIAFNKTQQKDMNIPELRAGDVIKVYRRIKEGAKQRTQMFQGMVIAINGKQSSSPSMTIRKVSSGVGVELILPLYSPQIEKIEFVKRTRARRSKLYFVRDKSVKVLSKKLKEIPLAASVMALLSAKKAEKDAAEQAAAEAEAKATAEAEAAATEEVAEVATEEVTETAA